MVLFRPQSLPGSRWQTNLGNNVTFRPDHPLASGRGRLRVQRSAQDGMARQERAPADIGSRAAGRVPGAPPTLSRTRPLARVPLITAAIYAGPRFRPGTRRTGAMLCLLR